jgi:ankyrin repeat protein
MPSEARAPVAAANDDEAAKPLPPPARIQELLFDAARLGRTDVLPALLVAGADIEAHDPKGYTALILASYNGQAAATELLLKHGALPDAPDRIRGNTALMGVAFKGYGAIAERLLDAGADPHATNTAGQTALMMAAMFGHSGIVDRLLAAGADPLAIDAAGNSAWSVARGQGNTIMVERLMRRASCPA